MKIIYLEDLGTGGANAEEVYEEEPKITMSDLQNLSLIRSRRNSTLHENQDAISFFLFGRRQPTTSSPLAEVNKQFVNDFQKGKTTYRFDSNECPVSHGKNRILQI